MDFIHVISKRLSGKLKEIDYEMLTLNVTKKALISLIHGLKQKKFGFDTTKDIALDIQRYVNSTPINFDLYIDSGGYSIIKGDVPFEKTHAFIECYHQYLEHHHQDFNYIFSLDIPFWGGQEENNTIENLYEFNKISLSYSRNLVENHKQNVIDKFLFVWQFKILGQFETWNKIYDELDINSWVKNRAIGGLVGLRGTLPLIDCSVFIPMAFRCLYDHLNGPYANDVFKLHFLGINLHQDRFIITLLDKLFQHYLKDSCRTDLTYDSISYTLKALKKIRDPKVFEFRDNTLFLYKSVHKLPDHIVDEVYFTPEYKEGFLSSLELLRDGENITETSVFSPLITYSEIMLDEYFSYLVDKYELVDILTSTDFKPTAMKKATYNLIQMEKNERSNFSDNFFRELQNDLDIIYDIYQLFIQGADRNTLDDWIRKMITENIRFPFSFK